MLILLSLILSIGFVAILYLTLDTLQRNSSCYPKVSFDEFITIYSSYKEAGKQINLYSTDADVSFGKGFKQYDLYLNTWKDRIKFHKWRKALDKQMLNKKKEQILAEVRKEAGSSPEVPADVYEAILNDLKKKYGIK